MGMTTIHAKVLNPADISRTAEVEFIIDSGAAYSVIPRAVLESIGIAPHSTRRFYLADGRGIDREMGFALFDYLGERTATSVIFGEEGDVALMGITTIEGFGFTFDPIRRELRPTKSPVILAELRRTRSPVFRRMAAG